MSDEEIFELYIYFSSLTKEEQAISSLKEEFA